LFDDSILSAADVNADGLNIKPLFNFSPTEPKIEKQKTWTK